MDNVETYSSDVAFTPTVKAIQQRKGSRRAYHRMEEKSSWETRITPDLAQFIGQQRSIFIATVNREGQPYVQHRGGPPGCCSAFSLIGGCAGHHHRSLNAHSIAD